MYGPSFVLSDFVDCADIRVVEPSGGLGFGQQALMCVWIEHIGPHALDGNLAVQPRVFGQEHFAHAPSAEPRNDPIVGDLISLHA